MQKKGFTLIELLIVIAIIAILAAAVVLVLNPAQLLAQARDGQRIADLDSVRSAINLTLSTATSPSTNTSSTNPIMLTTSVAATGTIFAAANTRQATSTSVSGTETAGTASSWVAVDLTTATGGSPIAVLPTDPVNNATFFYAYCGNSTNNTFEIDTALESTKYVGKETTDGGSNSAFYEVGNTVTC